MLILFPGQQAFPPSLLSPTGPALAVIPGWPSASRSVPVGLLRAWGGAHCWQGGPTGPMGAGGRGSPFLCTLTAGSGRNLTCQVCEMDQGTRVLQLAPSCTGSVTSPESALSSKAGLLTRAGGSGPPFPRGQGRGGISQPSAPLPTRIPGPPLTPPSQGGMREPSTTGETLLPGALFPCPALLSPSLLLGFSPWSRETFLGLGVGARSDRHPACPGW